MSESVVPPAGYRKVAFYSKNRLGYCVSDGENLRGAARISAASFENAYIEENEDGYTVYAHHLSFSDTGDVVPPALERIAD